MIFERLCMLLTKVLFFLGPRIIYAHIYLDLILASSCCPLRLQKLHPLFFVFNIFRLSPFKSSRKWTITSASTSNIWKFKEKVQLNIRQAKGFIIEYPSSSQQPFLSLVMKLYSPILLATPALGRKTTDGPMFDVHEMNVSTAFTLPSVNIKVCMPFLLPKRGAQKDIM